MNNIHTLEFYAKKIREAGEFLHLKEDYIEKIIQQHVRKDNFWLTHHTPMDIVEKRLRVQISNWDNQTDAPKTQF